MDEKRTPGVVMEVLIERAIALAVLAQNADLYTDAPESAAGVTDIKSKAREFVRLADVLRHKATET